MKRINLLEKSHHTDSIVHKEFAQDVKKGLSGASKFLLSKYLYDDEGSRLFKQITKLDEYYLTRTEMNIIQSLINKLPPLIDSHELDIIELGVGDGHKSSQIVKSFLDYGHNITYYPIDISAKAFDLLQSNISMFEHCDIKAIIGEYIEGLNYTKEISNRRKLVLFLGSNIGNFTPTQAHDFLIDIKKHLNLGDYLLTGFDLKKDVDLMFKAYNDSQGVTRAFNLNLLERINRELGGEFDLTTFKHHSLYNPRLSAMESHLLSLKKQDIIINALNMKVSFDYYEPIHLEFSFKFNKKDIKHLCASTGFKLIHDFVDEQGYFIDSLWQLTNESI
jgi:L-histidine Nalpha-methyltransferase